MKNKTMYGFLNWNRDHVGEVAKMGFDPESVIYCSNLETAHPYTAVKAVQNIAASRNLVIKKAMEKGAETLFVIEDDVRVKDMGVFDRYVDLMGWLGCSVAMYGFNSFMNKALSRRNPALVLRAEETPMQFNRFCCSSMMAFDLRKNKELFDESLICLEIEEYMWRCSEKGLHNTFYGMFPDVVDSADKFERMPFKTERVRTKEMLLIDKKALDDRKVALKVETNLDKLLNMLVDNPNLK